MRYTCTVVTDLSSELFYTVFSIIIILTFQFFQGIIGADGRHYILDLFRTFAPDANFSGSKLAVKRPKMKNYFTVYVTIDLFHFVVCCANF